RVASVKVDAPIESVRPEIIGVNLPDFTVLGARRLERVVISFGKEFGSAILAGHRRREPIQVDHSPSRSGATFSDRSKRSICVPSSKLSSAMNFNFAAYFIRTR